MPSLNTLAFDTFAFPGKGFVYQNVTGDVEKTSFFALRDGEF